MENSKNTIDRNNKFRYFTFDSKISSINIITKENNSDF